MKSVSAEDVIATTLTLLRAYAVLPAAAAATDSGGGGAVVSCGGGGGTCAGQGVRE